MTMQQLHNTRLFTRGTNTEGSLGLPSSVTQTNEFTQVTSVDGLSEKESQSILSMIDKVAVGRSNLLFSSEYFIRIWVIIVDVCGMNSF